MGGDLSDQTRHYAAFLSYAHADEAIARRVQQRLENFPIPAKDVMAERSSLKPIFRDVTELTAHHSLPEKIRMAVQNSRFLIVLCSPAAKKSHWVNDEIRLFRKLHGEGSILAAIIDGDPDTAFPPALIADGREPLAANMVTREGFRFGITQLAASMLGVGLDDLLQRERRRSRRRVTAVTAISALTVSIMAAMTWAATDARQEAEQRRNDAEGQIEFMLTDLKDKLEEVGRLDALNIVGQNAADYYDGYALSDHDDDALGRRARVFHSLGEIQRKLGNLPEADRYFERAYGATGAQLARDWQNPARVFEHAQSAFWVGYNHYDRKNYEDAQEYFESYLELAHALENLEGNSERATEELSYAFTNLGGVALARGQDHRAEGHYQAALRYKDRLLAAEPRSKSRLLSVSNAHAHLAGLEMGRAGLADATHSWETAYATLARIENKDTARDVIYRQLQATRSLSRLYLLQGKFAEADAIISDGKRFASKLLASDRDNVRVLYEAILLHVADFNFALAMQEEERLTAISLEAREKFETISESFRSSERFETLAQSLRMLDVYIALTESNFDEARAQVETLSAEVRSSIPDENPSEADWVDHPFGVEVYALEMLLSATTNPTLEFRALCRSPDQNLQYQDIRVLNELFSPESCQPIDEPGFHRIDLAMAMIEKHNTQSE